VPEEADLVLSETAILDTPLVLLDSLLFVVSPMLERMMRSAVERAYALRSLTLALQLEKVSVYERHIRPAIATQSRDLLLKLLNLDLQSHPPQAAILGVTLTAEARVRRRHSVASSKPSSRSRTSSTSCSQDFARLPATTTWVQRSYATAIVTMKSRWLPSVQVFTPLARPHQSHHVSHSAGSVRPSPSGCR
jgi:hypothetical protein